MLKKNTKPLVSIIVPVFNAEKYVYKCIDRVINQDYRNFKLILINDGSNYSSGDICKQYEIADNRVTFIATQNNGVSIARNIGINHSKGKFITFIDSDDYVAQTNISELLNSALLHKTDLSMYNLYSHYSDKIIRKSRY